jgi:hypothetical protein
LSAREDEQMAARQPLPRDAKEAQVALPSTHKDDEEKLGSSSGWKRDHLKMLGVDFYAKTKIDLNQMLRHGESEWSPEIRARMILL